MSREAASADRRHRRSKSFAACCRNQHRNKAFNMLRSSWNLGLSALAVSPASLRQRNSKLLAIAELPRYRPTQAMLGLINRLCRSSSVQRRRVSTTMMLSPEICPDIGTEPFKRRHNHRLNHILQSYKQNQTRRVRPDAYGFPEPRPAKVLGVAVWERTRGCPTRRGDQYSTPMGSPVLHLTSGVRAGGSIRFELGPKTWTMFRHWPSPNSNKTRHYPL